MELSFDQTNKFSLNSSSSKQQFLFSKAKRFPQINKSERKIKFYTLPSTITYQKQKAPSFPKLIKKLEFQNQKFKKIIPSPSTYSIKSDIQKSFSQKKGISIPKAKLTSKKSILSPGPFDYNPKREPYLTARYSIGHSSKKLQFPIQLQKGKQSPGPAYLVNVNKLQKVVSNYVQKKSLSVYSHKTTTPRVSKSLLLNPQSKLNKSQINNKVFLTPLKTKSLQRLPQTDSSRLNLQILSSRKSSILNLKNTPSVMGKFGKAERKTIFETKNNNPGPGYSRFSQFSQLQKKVYKERINKKAVGGKKVNHQKKNVKIQALQK